MGEARRILIEGAGFAGVTALPVCGHFGWNRLPVSLRWAGKGLDGYWRRVANPGRKWLYFGWFNPTLVLWVNKD